MVRALISLILTHLAGWLRSHDVLERRASTSATEAHIVKFILGLGRHHRDGHTRLSHPCVVSAVVRATAVRAIVVVRIGAAGRTRADVVVVFPCRHDSLSGAEAPGVNLVDQATLLRASPVALENALFGGGALVVCDANLSEGDGCPVIDDG